MKKWLCRWFGHRKPYVYHESRAFWWCGRCKITIGMDKALWTTEAMREFFEFKRSPIRN